MRQQNKKSKFVALLLSLLLVCTMMPQLAWATAGALEGKGTADDPYQISNADDLKAFCDKVNGGERTACAILTQNIDLGGKAWTPIGGTDGRTNSYYAGTFDGQKHTISNFKIEASYNYAGFFSYLKDSAHIMNLKIENATISSSKNNVGGIAGTIIDGTIEKCSFAGSVTYTGNKNGYAGGIAGYIGNSDKTTPTVKECVNYGTISANYAGGITGWAKFANAIDSCYNTGNIIGKEADPKTTPKSGGIVGQNMNGVQITNCYNIGKVTGTSCGAISGFNGVKGVTISNCYWTQPNDAKGGGPGNVDTASKKVDSPKDLAKKLGNSFKDGTGDGYPILTWQTGSAPEPAKPGIRIESSSGSSIWTVAGGKNQTSTTLSVAYDNMGEAKPDVTWGYPMESDAAAIKPAENDKNKLIVDAVGKKGGVLDITAKVTYKTEEYTQRLKLTVIPNITTVDIENVNGGAVAAGQTVEAKVNVEGGTAYDETTMPPLTYQWYQRNSLSTSGTGTLITGAKENTYSIPNDFADN